MPLQRQHNCFREPTRSRLRTTEPCDLENGWDREGPHLAVKLKDSGVSGCLGTEGLVVKQIHTFRREAVLPRVDWSCKELIVTKKIKV